MTLLVFGRTGQVARELARRAPDAVFLDRTEADLTDPEGCVAAIAAHAPAAVINAAAYTAVDRAEDEEELARTINADAPGAMAEACAPRGVPLVHLSTDYVFDGRGSKPWRPDDPVAPLGAYGRTKLAGEVAIRDAGGPHVILRTSWVFSAHGTNFAKTMLRLAEARDTLDIVDDQIGGPTPASDIAASCLQIASALAKEPEKSGTYHYAGAPDVSWREFAEAIFSQAGYEVAVTGIPTSAYPTPARRPLNSRLDCSTTEAAFGIGRPDWRRGVDEVLAALGVADGEIGPTEKKY
jgi:dTDP-4-dehydrorhamnose reductase